MVQLAPVCQPVVPVSSDAWLVVSRFCEPETAAPLAVTGMASPRLAVPVLEDAPAAVMGRTAAVVDCPAKRTTP
jgi:hypothetical protein